MGFYMDKLKMQWNFVFERHTCKYFSNYTWKNCFIFVFIIAVIKTLFQLYTIHHIYRKFFNVLIISSITSGTPFVIWKINGKRYALCQIIVQLKKMAGSRRGDLTLSDLLNNVVGITLVSITSALYVTMNFSFKNMVIGNNIFFQKNKGCRKPIY